MGILVGTLFCAYTVAKVERDAIFIAEYGALALPYAYIAVAVTSILYVWIEGRLLRRFTRIGATYLNQYIAIGFSLAAAAVFPTERHGTALALYLWTGSQAMILLPHFWVLALDIWDSRRARKLFPLFTACGLAGAVLGGVMAGWLTPFVKRVGLLWIMAGLLIVAHFMTRWVYRHRRHRTSAMESTAPTSRWRIISKSRYLQILAATLALSVIVATFVDFQFKYFAQHAYPDPHALTQFLGRFYAAINGAALLFQLGAAGWLLRRLDLAASTALQPITVMVLGGWGAVAQTWQPVVLMRGAQGVLSQVLGKSSSEIYYMAVRPPERRRIKPVIDTLVERWSDAVVGVLLLVALRVVRVEIPVLAAITVAISAMWLLSLLLLNRQYRTAIQGALGKRWVDPEAVADSMRIPAARAALVQALGADDERAIVLALRLVDETNHPQIVSAIIGCLGHSSAAVRAAAVEAMERKSLRDPEGRIEKLLSDPNAVVRRAAIGYLVTMSREPTTLVRSLLERNDPELCGFVLDVLLDRPHEAPGAIAPQWIDARLAAGTKEDLLLAARALGTLPGAAPVAALRLLLANPDFEIRRVALQSVARRPSRSLLDEILPLLLVPELSYEARMAVAAIGDPAIPALTHLLAGASGSRVQTLAARALAEIASQQAVDALMGMVRGSDRTLRHLGLRNLSRVRVLRGEPVLPRAIAHRLFLRELREYRQWLTPATRFEASPIPELRLLAESFREYSEMALERSMRALACWYEPQALFGSFERLRARQLGPAAPALEYLAHVLPRSVFRPVSKIFEDNRPDGEVTGATGTEDSGEWIRAAWQSGDAWLRACAVRASRYVPGIPIDVFQVGPDEPEVVRVELNALLSEDSSPRSSAVAARTATGC